MIRAQYLELCRIAVAHRLKIDPGQVRSRTLRSPRRAGLAPCRHAVDLYWETENSICRYMHVARIGWRSRGKIGDRQIMLLRHVKENVGAHKALFLTNTGFSAKAVLAADDAGIALLIVRPKGGISGPVTNSSDRPRPMCKRARKPRYSLQVVRPGMPPVLTKDEANRLIDLPDLTVWFERAQTEGRFHYRGHRYRLASLIPAMAPLLYVRPDWRKGVRKGATQIQRKRS
jgi:hypothetical protein